MEVTGNIGIDTGMTTEPTPIANSSTVEIPQVEWLQQMYDLDSIQWKGGESFYEGAYHFPSHP